MNKNKSAHSWLALLVNITVLMLAGCGAEMPINLSTRPAPTATNIATPPLPTTIPVTSSVPSLLPTIVPPYVHYTPQKAFDIYFEFDYPSSWILNEITQYADETIIDLSDPRSRTLPTLAPNESHGTPSDFGSVDIWVMSVKPDQNLDTLLESYKQGHSDASWITALKEYKIKIGAYDASVLEYQIEPWNFNGYSSVMFERDIFFAVKDQLYQITFTVAEKERGGEFEKGYEYLFNSLKIIP
jgi:hypothetical protein